MIQQTMPLRFQERDPCKDSVFFANKRYLCLKYNRSEKIAAGNRSKERRL